MANGRSFDDNDFGEHYRNRYGRTGRPYQDFQPAYRFGWDMAHEPQHQHRDWNALEQEAHHAWEQHSPRQRWEDMRDAVMEGFSRGRGVRRTNLGAMEGPGSGGTQAHQVSSGLRSGGTGDVTHAPQGSGTYPAPGRDADQPTINEGVIEGSREADPTGSAPDPQGRMDRESGSSPMGGPGGMTSAAGPAGAHGAGSAGDLTGLSGAREGEVAQEREMRDGLEVGDITTNVGGEIDPRPDDDE